MQESVLTRNRIDRPVESTRLLILNNLQKCTQRNLKFSYFLPNCWDFQPGQLLEVTGSLESVPDSSFFQPKGLMVQAVEPIEFTRGSVKSWFLHVLGGLIALKLHLLEGIKGKMASTERALVSGMVFGGTVGLSPDLEEKFRLTGLTHVVAASGYNVSIFAGVGAAIFERFFSRKVSGVLSIILVWCYSILAEFTAPVVRAAIMITIYLLGEKIWHRQYSVGLSLVISAGLMLIFQPFYLKSLSFWLSILSTAGIVLILPLLESSQGLFFRWQTGQVGGGQEGVLGELAKTNVFLESLLTTVAAQSLTLPLTMVVFGQFSLVSFVSNTTLLWLTPLITLSGMAIMLVPDLSVVTYLPAHLFIQGVEWFGQFESGLLEVEISWWHAWLWWGILGLVSLRNMRLNSRKKREEIWTNSLPHS